MMVLGIGVISKPLCRWTTKDLETFLYENSQLLTGETAVDISYDMKMVANNVVDIFLRETEDQKDAYEQELLEVKEELNKTKSELENVKTANLVQMHENLGLTRQVQDLLTHPESER